jgi:hypothetical protein
MTLRIRSPHRFAPRGVILFYAFALNYNQLKHIFLFCCDSSYNKTAIQNEKEPEEIYTIFAALFPSSFFITPLSPDKGAECHGFGR